MGEVRFYKGKHPVEVLLKSKGNWLVKALIGFVDLRSFEMDEEFTTVPRLLWREERKK